MKRSELTAIPEFFGNYIKEIEDVDLFEALIKYSPDLYLKELPVFEKIGGNTYAENKWTIKQIIQHLIDSERIFIYRGLSMARDQGISLPSFDENIYVEQSDSNRRSLSDLITEFESVRSSCLTLFQSFTEEMLLRTGKSSGSEISVAAVGFIIAGHTFHHYKVIKELYLPLAE